MLSLAWGQSGDVPVAADYDGDGEFDIAIFRPNENKWYIVNSGYPSLSTQTSTITFGESGDEPVPAAFVQ